MTATKLKAKVGRPRTPRDEAERIELQRIASLAVQVLSSARGENRGVWESERVLRTWLAADNVALSTGDLAPALALLEATGKIGRRAVKSNTPRPGWIITAAQQAVERGLNVNGHASATGNDVAAEDAPGPVAGPDVGAVTEANTEANTEAVDLLAKSIIRAFNGSNRGYQGNRAICPDEHRLREYLNEDGVTYDESDLAAALERLETATVPDSNSRLIRGEELRRLTGGSRHTVSAKLPERAMVLANVNPWAPQEYERADITPYLEPPSG